MVVGSKFSFCNHFMPWLSSNFDCGFYLYRSSVSLPSLAVAGLICCYSENSWGSRQTAAEWHIPGAALVKLTRIRTTPKGLESLMKEAQGKKWTFKLASGKN